MTVQLSVDLDAATPVYEQLRSQIAGHIGTGALQSGDPLPTLRRLAADLGIAVNTVARAYSELEAAGLVRSSRRVGTVVSSGTAAPVNPEVLSAALAFGRIAARHGIAEDAAVALIRHAIREIVSS